MVNYSEIDEIIAIHDSVIKQTGGKDGIFSFTLLHSAIERPKATFGGNELYPTDFEKAAALVHSLIQNHPFNDGNKRTALLAMVRFLHLNGYVFQHPFIQTVNFTLKIQKKKMTFREIINWIKKHALKVY